MLQNKELGGKERYGCLFGELAVLDPALPYTIPRYPTLPTLPTLPSSALLCLARPHYTTALLCSATMLCSAPLC